MATLDKRCSGMDSDLVDYLVGAGIRSLGIKEPQMTPAQTQSWALAATGAILFTVFAGSLVEWSKWLARQLRGETTSPTVREPQGTVGLIDLLVTFVTLVLLFYTAAILWNVMGLPAVAPKLKDSIETVIANEVGESSPATNAANGNLAAKPVVMTQNRFLYSGFAMSAQLACVLLVTLFIVGRTGCSFKKLGWRTDQMAGDLLSGIKCFLMMTPVILILNAVLQSATQTPYEHPVQEMIKQYPWLIGIAFWQAAIVAPISEEFGFRVLLIGWFESIHFGRDKVFSFMFGTNHVGPLAQPSTAEALGANSTNAELSNPYSANNMSTLSPVSVTVPSQALASEVTDRFEPPWWPVLLSGMLFGLAHFNYGVSWVPLIVFGVVLGRLYQVRQSLLPVLLVHFLFNGMNVMLLGLSLLLPVPVKG